MKWIKKRKGVFYSKDGRYRIFYWPPYWHLQDMYHNGGLSSEEMEHTLSKIKAAADRYDQVHSEKVILLRG